ncbi:MAG: MMPL family transporter [Pseudomonadota bacterium]
MTRSSRLAVCIWLFFLVASIAVISRTQFNADLSAFLPRTPTPAQQLLVEQLRDGVVSRLILIGLEGDTPEALAQISKRLATQLRKTDRFASINNGEDTGLEKDRDFLWQHRYLLSPAVTADHFSPAALREALEEDLQLLGSPAGMLLQRILPNDPSGELLRVIEQFEGQSKPAMQQGVWFSKNGRRALLVAQTKAAGSDIDGQDEALASIRSVFDETRGNGAAQLLLTGPGVFAVSSRSVIQGDASRFSTIATVLIASMLLVLYRSPRVLVLGLLPVVTGGLAGIAAVSLGFGSVHGITLGFGVTLIGEGVDYAIYLFTQIVPGTAPQNTLKRIWPTLRLGVFTSICGFSAMLLSGFPGLAQLGLFSIAGLVVAVAVTRYVLPALLPTGFSAQMTASIAPTIMAVVRRAPKLRYVLLLAVVIAGTLLFVKRDFLWSDDLASLSPIPKREQLLDEELRRDIGAPDIRHLIVVSAPDENAALLGSEKTVEILQRLAKQGVLQGFDSPAIYLPSREAQRTRQAAIPAPDVLRENLRQAANELPFRPELFEPFLKDAATAKTQPLIDRTSLQGTSLGLKFDTLLVKRSNGWAAMLPLRGVADPVVLAKELSSIPDVVLLDLKHESDHLYQTYRHEVVTYSLLGALAIVILLFASLRSPRRVFGVLAPLAAAVAITAALLVVCGYKLSIFHLVGLLLVVAVGSNYALFFDRQSSDEQGRERTIVSLLFANIATVIGFGLLSFSSVPVLNAIGMTVGIGAVLSLVFSAILIER